MKAETTQAFLLSSVDRTTSRRTARFTLTISQTTPLGDEDVTADGVIDFVRRRVEMTEHVLAQDVVVRVVDGTVYVKVGRTWQSMKTSLATNGPSPDVSDYMSYLRAVSNDVKQVSSEPVRGVATTHFSATLDVNKVSTAPRLTSEQRTMLKGLVEALHQSTFPIEVWVDDTGLLRRVVMKFEVPGDSRDVLGDTSDVSVDVSMEFFDFGTPVSIAAPAGASDVTGAFQNRAAQSDLRNALTAEKTFYTDMQYYSASAKEMKQIESSLDWGGTLTVVVGDAVSKGDKNVVCMFEPAGNGVLSIADVATGPKAGTYYGEVACPGPATAANVSQLGTSW